MDVHPKILFYVNDEYIGQCDGLYNTEHEYFKTIGFIIKGEKLRCYEFYNEDRNYSNYCVTIQHLNLRKINEEDNDIVDYDNIKIRR